MKTTLRYILLAAGLALGHEAAQAQPAIWNNGAADNNWNSAGNWDIGVPAEGTNAFIGAGNTVNYTSPMVATSFGGLTNIGSVLNIGAAGFVVGNSGNHAAFVSGSTSAKLYVNNGGGFSVPSGGLTFSTNGAGALAVGGALTVGGTMNVGIGGSSGSGGGAGAFTNFGGALTTGALNVNGSSGNPQNCVVYILGGTNQFAAVSVGRSTAGSGGFNAFGQEGLIISNGIVTMTSLDVGASGGNTFLTAYVGGGAVTNTGTMIVRQGSANRASRFLHSSGYFVSGSVNLRGHTANNVIVIYSVTGGTNLVDGFVLGNSGGGDTTGTIRLTNAAKIYIGAGGISSVGTLNTKTIALNSGGVFGAQADWSGTEPILLTGGSFDAAGLDGTAHNISLSGVASGTGALTKNGAGTLTLNVANTFSGNTLINQGTLALGAAGSIANSPQIVVASGATFDVSAVSGYTLASARTLAGLGNVSGNVAVASGGIINPGTGTLTLANALTETGGAINHFDLPTTPGPGNDLLVVNGDLNVSGVNTLEIVGGGAPGTVHTLIQYGGNFNGALANFSISGASGTLSNNATLKTIALIIAAAVRTPTNVVWVGNASNNDWDTVNRTNWINTGTGLIDYFVSGDNALFNAAGAANPNVNIPGNVAPATLTVGAAGNYTFGGAGSITGSGGLTKTNTGTLVVNTTNSYTGVTTIAGGVLEAGQLAIGGVNSAIGAANVSAANLVFDGGTLRYTGPSVSIDRAATINAGGARLEVASVGTALSISGASVGAGALTKSGAGQVTLTSGSSYSGGTIISNGVLQLNATAAAGPGGITNYGATLRVSGATTEDNQLDFNGVCALEFTGVGSGNVPLRGAWTGNGTVNVNFLTQNASQTFSIGGEGAGGGHMWDFSGTVDFGVMQGFARLNNNSSINFGSSNATFNLGTANLIFVQRNGGTTTHLGALLGGPNTRLSGARNDVTGTTTYSIGGKNLDTVYEGMITNGQSGSSIRPASIIKVGTGKLTLTGLSPYTGLTRIEAGTLQVDGQITASPFTVMGGTLSGNGSIGSSVDVQFGAYLSPGTSVGRLSIGTLTLNSGATNLMEIDKANGTNDSIAVTGTISYGGALVVNNLGGTLADGDVFRLFEAPENGYFGAFETIELPVLAGPDLFWDTSRLAVDGTIRVFTPKPAITEFGLTGSNFFLTGTNGGNTSTHYIVVTSTNVAAPANLWTPVYTNTFADGTLAFTNAVNPATPAQFFRVKTP